jgi:Ni/Co efflux regulator RcnB
MRKLITTMLAGAMLLPVAATIPTVANAQSARELQRDRRDIRDEQRDLRRAQRTGNARDVRDAREDLREARREYREDFNDRRHNWRDNDWQGYRQFNRGLYARGNWRAPFRYQRFAIGGRIAPVYFGQNYWIRDPWRLRLPVAGVGRRWIRHYNDVVLVDYRRGRVIRVIPNFYW